MILCVLVAGCPQTLQIAFNFVTLSARASNSATILNDGVDFVKLAEALGAEGYRATNRAEFAEALQKAGTLDIKVFTVARR